MPSTENKVSLAGCTKYYYKTKVVVYDKGGKLVKTTAFKQSDVAYRTWKK